MPAAPVPALDADVKLARLAVLKEALARKGHLLEIPDASAPAGPPALATGWPEVDALLGGGFPRRGVTEVIGAAACGKTSLVAHLLAPLTRSGALAAWIDATAEAYPPAFAAAGVDLARLLFVRSGTPGVPATADDAAAALWAAEVLLQSGTFAAVVLDATSLPAPPRRALDRRAPILRAAAESYDASLVVLAREPFGLPPALRLRTEARPEGRVRIVIDKARTSASGAATIAAAPPRPEPPVPPPPPLLARAVKTRAHRSRR